MNKKYDELVNEVIEWTEIANPKDIDKWIEYCSLYLKDFNWNNKAIKDITNWGKDGFNNKSLQFKVAIEDFYDEVYYCADRMTIDRLIKCHILYYNYKNNK